MRSVWKGAISFGLVNIPCAVYPATREERVSFKQLRKSDLSPIKYKKVAEVDDEEVPSKEIVKGYEYEKGRWVTLSDEDFEEVQIESTHSIDITDFVNVHDINPKYFYKPYLLEALKGGDKSYALLHRALQETGKVGIAKVAIRNREYLAAVRVDGLFLVLELMHFAHEVLDTSELKTPPSVELNAKEIQMARMLVESMSSEWEPEKYNDRYQDALKEVIDRKVQKLPRGKTTAPRTAPVIDILEALKQSLAKGNTKAPAGAGRKPGKTEAPDRPRSTKALVSSKRRGASLSKDAA